MQKLESTFIHFCQICGLVKTRLPVYIKFKNLIYLKLYSRQEMSIILPECNFWGVLKVCKVIKSTIFMFIFTYHFSVWWNNLRGCLSPHAHNAFSAGARIGEVQGRCNFLPGKCVSYFIKN